MSRIHVQNRFHFRRCSKKYAFISIFSKHYPIAGIESGDREPEHIETVGTLYSQETER